MSNLNLAQFSLYLSLILSPVDWEEFGYTLLSGGWKEQKVTSEPCFLFCRQAVLTPWRWILRQVRLLCKDFGKLLVRSVFKVDFMAGWDSIGFGFC